MGHAFLFANALKQEHNPRMHFTPPPPPSTPHQVTIPAASGTSSLWAVSVYERPVGDDETPTVRPPARVAATHKEAA